MWLSNTRKTVKYFVSALDFEAEALIQEATFNLAVTESKASLCDSWLAHKASTEEHMGRAHPILWHIPQWRKQQMAQVKVAFMKVKSCVSITPINEWCVNQRLHLWQDCSLPMIY